METFLTGSIFAVATNLILLTSTKVISFFVLAIDVFTGMPARFVGGLLNKPPSPSIFSTVLKVYGNVVGSARQAFEAFDSFVGKYLGFLTVLYIGFKFIHYKFEFF